MLKDLGARTTCVVFWPDLLKEEAREVALLLLNLHKDEIVSVAVLQDHGTCCAAVHAVLLCGCA